MPSLNMILPLILSLLPLIQAHDNGMDMSMDGSMGLASGQMLTYLHFTKGDILWFQGWVPGKAGTMFAACFALFLVAVFERWVACLRAVGEHFWRKRAEILRVDRLNQSGRLPTASTAKSACCSTNDASRTTTKTTQYKSIFSNVPPFIFEYEVSRGVLHALQSAMQFAFMLATMTFQLGFILSIIIGLGVGEAMFGRFASHAAHFV